MHAAAAEDGRARLWGAMGRYGEIWGDMGRYGELWGDMGRYGEIWGDISGDPQLQREVREGSGPNPSLNPTLTLPEPEP